MASPFAIVSAVTGSSRSAARLADVLGAETGIVPALRHGENSVAAYLGRLREANASAIPDGSPASLVGASIGAAVGLSTHPEHKIQGGFLGAIEGYSIGRNAPALMRPELRREAWCNMGQTTAAVALSRMLPGSPIIGFALGWILSGGAIYYWDLRGEK